MLRTTIAANDDVVLVALGPPTNVAEVLAADPGLTGHIEMMHMMGGAVEAGGNVFYANEAAEFNIWADSLAAEMVFATEVPITMIPLDATNSVPVTPALYETIEAHRNTSEVIEFLADYLDVAPLIGGVYHWDELAAVVATEESVATIEDQQLVVVASGGERSGATVPADSGRQVRVAVGADPVKFGEAFYGALLGPDDVAIEPWAPDATMSWDGETCMHDGPEPLPDSMWLRVDNDRANLVAWLLGAYDAGTTADDFAAYIASGSTDPPEWWPDMGQIAVPAAAHNVWLVEASPDATAMCYADPAHFWEIAGRRLSN